MTMGLDMYLRAEKYCSNHEFSTAAKRKQAKAVLKAAGAKLDAESVTVSVTVAYWRKANAIHAWFVDNLAGGTDDCSPVYVSREDLVKLKKLCKKTLSSPDKQAARDMLPTRSGFFFGSTEYDECYQEDLKNTISQLTDVLEYYPENEWTFYYEASW